MKIKSDINLYDTLMSGQAFRINIEDDDSFTIIISDRILNIKQENDYIVVNSNNEEDLELVTRYYLDLDRDYDVLNKELSKNEILKRDINLCKGYKVLKQDKFEMYISYIISQNNNVKRIAGSINKISERFGKKVKYNNKEYYLFPTFVELKNITIEELRECGVGFRDSYIINALNKLKENPFFLEELDMLPTDEAIKELMKIKGIGLKVASCILMFGYSRFDTFPVDTWVKKYVSENFKIKDDIKIISKFMKDNFKENSGLAVQYFYHINRNKKQGINWNLFLFVVIFNWQTYVLWNIIKKERKWTCCWT